MNQKFNVGIYLRLSDEDKIKKDNVSESIKNQRHLLLLEIKKHPDFVFVDEYSDEDLSGAGTYRPEFERMIKDCKNHKLDIIMCKSQSRFSRDMEIIEHYIHNKFLEWNIRFISISDNADTENKGNKKQRQINALVNEWFLEDVSNNIRSAFNVKMKLGEYISPFAPYGYEISKEDNNKLIVDLEAATIVKKIYELYLNGVGYTGIANILNERKILTPSRYKIKKGIKLNIITNKNIDDIKWSSNMIKTILKNEVYIGNLVQGKRSTISYKNKKTKANKKEMWIKCENTHESIIDKKTFYRVKKEMLQRTRPCKYNNRVHIFSGKTYCKVCNGKLRKKNSGKYNYLVCEKHTSIRYDLLERIVFIRIKNVITNFESNITELNRFIIESFIKNIYVSNDSIKILWNKNHKIN